VQGRGQLDHSEAGAQVTASHRDHVDQFLAQLVGELAQIFFLEPAQVRRLLHLIQERCRPVVPNLTQNHPPSVAAL
jgi:hypothetical protein